MRITPKPWSLMTLEERNHYVEAVKESMCRLYVQEYGEDYPQAESIKEMDIGLLRAAFEQAYAETFGSGQ